MTTSRALAESIDRVRAMPHGPDRTREAEVCVAEADRESDEVAAVRSRLLLVDSYGGVPGEQPKVFVPFAWLLTRWDGAPELFDSTDRHAFLWYFKWVTVYVLDHPEVPLARVEQALADMRTRYVRAGEALAPYEKVRYKVLRHVLGERDPRTTAAYHRWLDEPRTALSDCATCEPTDRVLRLVSLGEHEDAVRTALPALAEAGCSEQPQRMADAALASLVLSGLTEQAAAEHSRAVRLHGARGGTGAELEDQILLCARVGRLGRGLDLLTRAVHQVDSHAVAGVRMRLAAAGARLLTGLEEDGHGDVEVVARRQEGRFARPWTVARLRPELERAALELAARFDARNATSTVGDDVRATLASPDLPRVAHWPVAARYRALDRLPQRQNAVPAQVRHPDLPADRLGVLLDLRREATLTGRAQAWETLVQKWAALRPAVLAAGDLAARRRADVVRLDVACTLYGLFPPDAAPADDEEAGAALAEAVLDLRSAGLEAQALLLEQQVVVSAAEAGESDLRSAVLACAELAARCRAVGSDGETAQAYVTLALAARSALRSLVHDDADVGPGQDEPDGAVASLTPEVLEGQLLRAMDTAESLFESVPQALLTGSDRGRWARVLLLRSEFHEHEVALDLLDDALDVVPPGVRVRERATLLTRRGDLLVEVGDLAGAVAAFDAAADDAGLAGDTWARVTALSRCGDALLDADHDADAADRLLAALDAAVEVTDDPLWRLRADLVLALHSSGRALDAARFADEALDLLNEHTLGDDDPGAAFHAGRFAYTAALALRTLGETDHASRLALAAAGAHAHHPVAAARARALDLAAATCDDVTRRVLLAREALGVAGQTDDSGLVADLHLRLADAVEDADGPDAALAVLDDAWAGLAAGWGGDPAAEPERAWHRAALAHFRGGVLLRAERFAEAVDPVSWALDAYDRTGDADNAAAATSLLAAALHADGRTDQAIDLVRSAAEEALLAGEADRARRLGTTLARLLDDGGDPEAADEAWRRFGGG